MTWTIRRVDDHRIIGTVTSFTTANEICRHLTERGIVAEALNYDDEVVGQAQQTQEDDDHE